jgi:hypothetical protein
MYCLNATKDLQALDTLLGAETTLFVTHERNISLHLGVAVHPDTSGLKLVRNTLSLVCVPSRDGCSEANPGRVGSLDHVGLF